MSKPNIVVLLSLLLLAAACPTKVGQNLHGYDCDQRGVCVPKSDAGSQPDGSGPAEGGPAVARAVTIVSPDRPAYTNGAVRIEISADPIPDTVALLKNGVVLHTWSAGPYSFVWDTAAETEGPYEVTARASYGAGVITSAPLTVRVDRTAPTVESVRPQAGAQNVVLSDPLEITFSEPLDPTTVNASSVALAVGTTPVESTATLSADGRVVAVRVGDRSRLTFPAVISETIMPGLADRAGNRLAPLTPWLWTAPRWIHMPMLPLAVAGEAAARTSLALDETGRPLLAYISPDPERRATVARYSPGAAWDSSIPSPAQPIDAVMIASGANGVPVLAWSSDRTYVARLTGTSWDRLFGNVPDDNIMGLVSGLAVDPSGAPVVTWNSRPTAMTESVAYVARWTAPAWQRVGTAGVGTGRAVLRVDSTGAPGLFTGIPGTENARLFRYTDGAWQPIDITRVGTLGGSGAVVAFTFDARNRLVIAVREPATSARALWFHYFDGSGWLPLWVPITTDADIGEVVFVVDSNGTPTVAWTQVSGLREGDVRVDRYANGAWDRGYGVLGTGYALALALDAAGAPVVSWTTNQMAAMARANR